MLTARKTTVDTSSSIKPFLSILTPAFNEEAILERSVKDIYKYMDAFAPEYDWELVLVNDGSKDDTGKIADALAGEKENMRVVHHKINRNLGGALQTGFSHCGGQYIIVLDIDLSYAPDHIEKLLTEAIETDADIVVASPYMKGGRNTKVPAMRLLLSKTVNRLLALTSPVRLHTFTGMVRLYRSAFLRNLNLKSTTYSINPEIINKAAILRGRIREIPAHLDWSFQNKSKRRTSSVRIYSGILAGFMTSFIFRPYAFFMSIGLFLLAISMYVILWIFINTFNVYPDIAPTAMDFENAFSLSVAKVFRERPYSFIVGGITMILALQFLSLGFLSLQNKRYFDELFHLGSSHLKRINPPKG
jgi:glycosyltransferase involved in cell wall biosynthesis